MIAYLCGTVQKKHLKALIINTGNVGYLVHVPSPLLEKFHEEDSCELYIHTKVREDDISLFGFENFEQLSFFKTLLTVNGIGPKLGLEIMSLDPQKTKAAIIQQDIAFLSHIPGIGKKTAERIIVELKNKIELDDPERTHISLEKTTAHDEALTALQNLGYQQFEIIRVLKNMPEKVRRTEEIITFFLQNIAT